MSLSRYTLFDCKLALTNPSAAPADAIIFGSFGRYKTLVTDCGICFQFSVEADLRAGFTLPGLECAPHIVLIGRQLFTMSQS